MICENCKKEICLACGRRSDSPYLSPTCTSCANNWRDSPEKEELNAKAKALESELYRRWLSRRQVEIRETRQAEGD